jgi:hypothetical protein
MAGLFGYSQRAGQRGKVFYLSLLHTSRIKMRLLPFFALATPRRKSMRKRRMPLVAVIDILRTTGDFCVGIRKKYEF